jgi:hypothetical protein
LGERRANAESSSSSEYESAEETFMM